MGHDSLPRAVIPAIITQLLAGKDTLQLGNLKPTRDFLFVKDTVNAILSIAQNRNLPEKPLIFVQEPKFQSKTWQTPLFKNKTRYGPGRRLPTPSPRIK
jgi:nucleoside-diphosphate-sugar epimerase